MRKLHDFSVFRKEFSSRKMGKSTDTHLHQQVQNTLPATPSRGLLSRCSRGDWDSRWALCNVIRARRSILWGNRWRGKCLRHQESLEQVESRELPPQLSPLSARPKSLFARQTLAQFPKIHHVYSSTDLQLMARQTSSELSRGTAGDSSSVSRYLCCSLDLRESQKNDFQWHLLAFTAISHVRLRLQRKILGKQLGHEDQLCAREERNVNATVRLADGMKLSFSLIILRENSQQNCKKFFKIFSFLNENRKKETKNAYAARWWTVQEG